MDRAWYVRLFGVLLVCGLAVYLLYPSYYFYFNASREQRDDYEAFCNALPVGIPCTKFNLGLDLQGGVHLVMGVKTGKAVEQRTDRLAQSLRDGLSDEGVAFDAIERPRNTSEIQVRLADNADADRFEDYVRQDFSVLELVRREQGAYVYELLPDEARIVRRSAVDQALKTIRNRTNKLGVTEPVIAKQGNQNILIQLPGVKDPDRAIRIIGRTAQLEFKIVDESASQAFADISADELGAEVERQTMPVNRPAGKTVEETYFVLPDDEQLKEKVRARLEEQLPGNREVAYGHPESESGAVQQDQVRTYVLEAQAGITGDYLVDASVRQNPDLPSDTYVSMDFDTKGAEIFETLTENNVGRRMAVVLDGMVHSQPPVIEERIGGGKARITMGGAPPGRSRFDEARELALVLKAGALPAPVEVLDKRQVGKTLGAESVRSGTIAIAVGTVLVVLFMLLYYRRSGLIADLALALNIVFVLAILALFEATLTLPGMAGIVLTVGMAVDANVIIFERIREELRAGKTPRAAVDSGYGKAFSTIFDANVTTLIAGVVLMQYGEGPIRGFAVTLIIGILCSMFTAIVVTRLFFDFFTGRRRLQSLSI